MYRSTVRRCSPELRERARQLRREATPAEQSLWQAVRGNALGAPFRRQHPTETCIFDFYCPAHRLVVEIDGPIHDSMDASRRDAARDEAVRAHGLRVLRFTNEEVLEHRESVLARIRAAMAG